MKINETTSTHFENGSKAYSASGAVVPACGSKTTDVGLFDSHRKRTRGAILVYGAKSIAGFFWLRHTGKLIHLGRRVWTVCVCVWHMRWEPEVPIADTKKWKKLKYKICRSRVQFGNQLPKRRGGLIEIGLIWHHRKVIYIDCTFDFWLGPFTGLCGFKWFYIFILLKNIKDFCTM